MKYVVKLEIRLEEQQNEFDEIQGRRKETMTQLFNSEINVLKETNYKLNEKVSQRDKIIRKMYKVIGI